MYKIRTHLQAERRLQIHQSFEYSHFNSKSNIRTVMTGFVNKMILFLRTQSLALIQVQIILLGRSPRSGGAEPPEFCCEIGGPRAILAI